MFQRKTRKIDARNKNESHLFLICTKYAVVAFHSETFKMKIMSKLTFGPLRREGSQLFLDQP